MIRILGKHRRTPLAQCRFCFQLQTAAPKSSAINHCTPPRIKSQEIKREVFNSDTPSSFANEMTGHRRADDVGSTHFCGAFERAFPSKRNARRNETRRRESEDVCNFRFVKIDDGGSPIPGLGDPRPALDPFVILISQFFPITVIAAAYLRTLRFDSRTRDAASHSQFRRGLTWGNNGTRRTHSRNNRERSRRREEGRRLRQVDDSKAKLEKG
ncbi:hypothetical protein CEXT_645961 [Caerostris extrusa]|uniref:Uncharacterized protein n=1 Tax=Caerostris extrusa TaxID=172846 RepID=A0AAV4MFZ6_CAEEX|nr:hypothetical protein CEXT_645961 [Caerostris extrusa]